MPLLARNLFLKLCKFESIFRYEAYKALVSAVEENVDKLQKYFRVIKRSTGYESKVLLIYDDTYDSKPFIDLGTVLNQEDIVNNNLLDNSWFR